jgi:acetyl esterase
MPLDPVLQELIEVAREMGPVDRSHLPVAEQRRAGLEDLAALFRDAGERGPAMANALDRTAPGPNGDVPIRVYTPIPRRGARPAPATRASSATDASIDAGAAAPGAPAGLPLHLCFHGGGWWTGDLEMVDDECRHLADGVPCVVVSVDYRLAPEHPFPAPLEDCFAATDWAWRNAASLGCDPRRLSVGGASAGGNLAAAVCLLARERGGPPLVLQVLECPAFDPDLGSDSMRELGDDYMLTRDGLAVAWSYYLQRPEDRRDPCAAPLLADDLAGLPPALVVTAEYDPLRDEGEEYGRRLAAAGVATQTTRYDGVIHGFGGLTRALAQARACRAEIIARISQASAADGRDPGASTPSR